MGLVYCIKKEMKNDLGKKTHVLLTNGLEEVLEFDDITQATRIVEVMNANTDCGWVYTVIPIGK